MEPFGQRSQYICIKFSQCTKEVLRCSIGWVQLDIPLGIYCNCSQVSWSYLQSLRKLYQQTPLDQNQTTVGILDHKTWPIILIFYIDWCIIQYLHKMATFWTLTWNILSVLINYLLFRFLFYFIFDYYKFQRSNSYKSLNWN